MVMKSTCCRCRRWPGLLLLPPLLEESTGPELAFAIITGL